jgi:hypothetical protein
VQTTRLNNQNMESIELLKEMELARQCLGHKNEILQKKEEDNMTKQNDEFIGIQDHEESETDDFIFVQSRKKREYRKGVKKGCKGKAQEILGPNKKTETLGKSQKVWMIIIQIKMV